MAEPQDEATIKVLIGWRSGRAPSWGHYKDIHWLEGGREGERKIERGNERNKKSEKER